MLKTSKRVLALVLMLAMTVSMFVPMTAFAAAGSTTDYPSFLADLKVLEGYAESYAASNSANDENELMLNFIRTGVDRYNDGNWKTLAGEEITGFTSYVEAQDAANGTTVMDLRDIVIDDFKLPNGNLVDFGHMFGTMNIAYVTSEQTADLGGWAGDLCDLLFYTFYECNVPAGTVDEMAAYVLENCFGVDADDAFGMDDFYGDMDAFYLDKMIKSGASLSEVTEAYFTADLSNADRAAYFLNNRFGGLETKEDVRAAIYDTYAANIGLQVLEADRGLSDEADLRRACCYAFADYLFDLAGDRLEGDTGSGDEGGETPDDPTDPDEPEMDNDYYSVFSSTGSTLAPGITQTINYAQTVDKKQIVYYVATVDVNREDVTIMANYRDNDPSKGWGMQRVEDQAKALVAKHTNPADTENYIENFNAIVATNADGYNMSTGQPGGLLVMEGVEWHPVDKDGFFAILKDGSAMIGTQADYATYKTEIQEGIGGFGAVLIKDGEVVTSKLGSYYSTRASRTAIGITADGKVVMMVLDGRQEPFSAGGAMEEIAQIMLDAGCVDAINLDGGGSTTYLSKPEGEDSLKLLNRPSDGYARSVSTSLVAVSTAKSSKEFDHANISSDYEYLTVGTSLTLTATGVSNTGNAAPIPADAQWTVSDANIGNVTADGVFTAAANGDVEVQLVSGGNVIGSIALHVVVPDALIADPENINAIFGVAIEIPLKATYEGNYVAFNDNDVILGAYEDTAGIFEGRYFTGDESVGIRKVNGVAMILANEAYTMFTINLYKADEAFFDFDNVTSGNKQFAWLRDVSNSETKDDILYQVIDSENDMVTDYTFAIDMTQIEIPDQLADLTSMLPGADTGATAWDFMLQLAERVSVLSEVKITAQFDKNFDVDVSEMQVSNEYFELKSAVVDENNTLTMVCNWIDQTSAIDPATANPICILSGIKLTPKDDAAWNSNNRLNIVNTGDVSYRIYLRASSLYSFANKPENQEKYDLYPYSASDTGYEGGTESGAYFGKTYTTFRDEYTLDSTNRNGWYADDSLLYYYVNNELLPAGIHEVPSYEDPSVKLWYEFDESGASLGTYTGLIEKDGKLMYAMQGELRKGWQSVMDENGESWFYYFSPYTYAAVGAGEGWITVENFNYYFKDYKCIRGEIVKTSGGLKYRFAGLWQRNQWVVLDGKYYFIGRDFYVAANGIVRTRSYDGSHEGYLLFDENGVWQKDFTGIYNVGSDSYYVKDGERVQEPGLLYIDGYYYYFCSTAKAVKNCTYWPTKTNGLLPAALYKFDEQGRMINPPVITPEEPDTPGEPDTPDTPAPPVKDGFVSEFGALYYYKNGVKQYNAGLIYLDGNYYYVRSNGQVATGNYWVTNHNGLLPEGMYNFDENGVMTNPPVTEPDEPDEPDTPVDPDEPDEPDTPVEPEEPEVPAVKNGIVEENGILYYYKNGSRAYNAGLMKLDDGSYIYVRSNAQLAIGEYWATNHNGLLPEGIYNFGTDGKMILETPDEPDTPDEPETPETPDEPEVKNGFISENGGIFYYVDGKKQYCAGLIVVDGDYYYVRSNAALAIGRYWTTNHNGLVTEGIYEFGEDGKMIDPPAGEEPEVKNGFVEVDGVVYYYKDNAKQYNAGLIVVDGDYYYVRSTAEVVTGRYWVTNHNGLVAEGIYEFGEDGKMIDPPTGEEPEILNGVVEVDGILYYYKDNAKQYAAGLVLLEDGNYIYVRSNAQLAIGRYWVSNTNGYVEEGVYTFGEDGMMIV